MRTFTGRTMADALTAVRRELGTEAVVLHTRSFKTGGVLGIGAKTVVEVTATDGRAVGRRKRAEARRSPRAMALAERREKAASSNTASVEPMAGDLIKKTYAAAKAEISREAGAAQSHGGAVGVAEPPAVVNGQPMDAMNGVESPASVPAPATEATEELTQELQSVKAMVARVMRSQAGPCPELPKHLVKHYTELIEQEVTGELAEAIVTEARRLMNESELDDEKACHEAVRRTISKYLPVDPEAADFHRPGDGRPRTIALVGPTGVGKTTTLAKLAATFKLKAGRNIAMITLDTYRIAAVEQLRTYAGIIGVPLKVCSSPAELNAAVASFAHFDAVLIDTAGRSQRDADKLIELQAMIESVDPHEVHLVLSSTCTQRVILETIERFARVRTDRLIFTKLDEAVTGGVLLNVAKLVGKRLSYVTTGQEVPHQIEPSDARRLAEVVMGQRMDGTDG
ncbi:MAG: flagellar biosynthesis protein FlhF [Planctomycetota bacterium]